MKKLIAAVAIALMSVTGTAAVADEYPGRPIMLMVSYGAGGATDFQARIVTMTAGNEDALGMPIRQTPSRRWMPLQVVSSWISPPFQFALPLLRFRKISLAA